MKEKWYVYIIQSVGGKLYAGITKTPLKRFSEHAFDKKKGAKFFRSDPPDKIVYLVEALDRSEASKHESFIKGLPRKKKIDLIGETKLMSFEGLS